MYDVPDNTEKSYKCIQCGMMFSTGVMNRVECPFCNYLCKPGECEILGSSNEEY